MTSSCKWLTALKYDLVLCEGWITNRCSGNEPGLPRERQRKSSLYYLLCESNKRRLAYYFDRSIVYWPIIVKFRKLKQTLVVFYRLIGLFLCNTLQFQKYFWCFRFVSVTVMVYYKRGYSFILSCVLFPWTNGKKVISCQSKHPTPVIGTLRADFSRFVFSFCSEETHFKMAYQVFALKRNFRPS